MLNKIIYISQYFYKSFINSIKVSINYLVIIIHRKRMLNVVEDEKLVVEDTENEYRPS